MTTYFKNTKLWRSNRKSTASATASRSFEDTKERFKSLSDEAALQVLLCILEVVKCKVCRCVVSLPMMVSNTDGELICETCLSTDSISPDLSCVRSLSPTEESILTSVILAIPHECRYKGCPCVIVPGDDHNVWCGFQETSCKLCDWVGAARDIVRHAVRSHLLEPLGTGEFTVARELENFDPNKEHSTFTPVFVGDVFLWAETNVDTYDKEFENNYIYVPNGKQSTKIFVKVILGDECLQNVNSIQIELNLNPIFATSKRNSIVFPTSVMDEYIDQNKSLKWKEVFTAETL